MAVLSITYDLHKEPSREYQRLFAAIKKFSGWYHALESTWFIWTKRTPDQVYTFLRPHLHAKDVVCIVPVPHDRGWWTQGFSPRAIEWLRYHLSLQAAGKRIG